MNNNTITNTDSNTTTKNITLTQAIRALYGESSTTPIKNVVETLKTSPSYSHLTIDYRKVYNTWKRVSGKTNPVKTKKTSVVLDLTMSPSEGTVPGVVVSEGVKA